jgi:hypothetical protein
MALNQFIGTVTLMAALKTLIAALESAPGVKMFERVDYFATPNLVEALQQLKIAKSRICLIVPSANNYDTKIAGREVQTETIREFILLLADRDFGKRQNALTGGTNSPGVVAMNDLLEDRLLGQNLNQAPIPIKLRPSTSEVFQLLGNDEDQTTGRIAWQMTWQCSAGRKIVTESLA